MNDEEQCGCQVGRPIRQKGLESVEAAWRATDGSVWRLHCVANGRSGLVQLLQNSHAV
jgi:hypothetical protein